MAGELERWDGFAGMDGRAAGLEAEVRPGEETRPGVFRAVEDEEVEDEGVRRAGEEPVRLLWVTADRWRSSSDFFRGRPTPAPGFS